MEETLEEYQNLEVFKSFTQVHNLNHLISQTQQVKEQYKKPMKIRRFDPETGAHFMFNEIVPKLEKIIQDRFIHSKKQLLKEFKSDRGNDNQNISSLKQQSQSFQVIGIRQGITKSGVREFNDKDQQNLININEVQDNNGLKQSRNSQIPILQRKMQQVRMKSNHNAQDAGSELRQRFYNIQKQQPGTANLNQRRIIHKSFDLYNQPRYGGLPTEENFESTQSSVIENHASNKIFPLQKEKILNTTYLQLNGINNNIQMRDIVVDKFQVVKKSPQKVLNSLLNAQAKLKETQNVQRKNKTAKDAMIKIDGISQNIHRRNNTYLDRTSQQQQIQADSKFENTQARESMYLNASNTQSFGNINRRSVNRIPTTEISYANIHKQDSIYMQGFNEVDSQRSQLDLSQDNQVINNMKVRITQKDQRIIRTSHISGSQRLGKSDLLGHTDVYGFNNHMINTRINQNELHQNQLQQQKQQNQSQEQKTSFTHRNSASSQRQKQQYQMPNIIDMIEGADSHRIGSTSRTRFQAVQTYLSQTSSAFKERFSNKLKNTSHQRNLSQRYSKDPPKNPYHNLINRKDRRSLKNVNMSAQISRDQVSKLFIDMVKK
ncbi:UNKNOWN [Stylonychia lemnae]|uniref:Uncharacterized protein n=1 Tax=Stylonychia lemnae TaxID=5949 RepID=A0A077ZTZ8_STYLE|nr:UNKNOWN [Stylonychia lemnae]|eukprot:CDW71926.1 UNKNOWN [Stylonychia lemnae]